MFISRVEDLEKFMKKLVTHKEMWSRTTLSFMKISSHDQKDFLQLKLKDQMNERRMSYIDEDFEVQSDS